MRKIIKDRQIVADHWQHIDDEAAVPPTGDVIVSWARWQREHSALLARDGGLGVRLDGAVDPATVGADSRHFDLIALEFPIVKDGRCYSHARLLRARYGFRGELRAVGEVLRDQLFYMQRVGINAFEVPADRDLDQAIKGLEDFSVTYQGAADARTPVWRRRRGEDDREQLQVRRAC